MNASSFSNKKKTGNRPAASPRGHSALVALSAAFVLGVLTGALAVVKWNRSDEVPIEIRQGEYQFINPLLECEPAEESIRQQALVPFKSKIERLVAGQGTEGLLVEASVYFRDLNNGPWFGIREREQFVPASLLKVVTMMAVLHEAEGDGRILQKKLRNTSSATGYRQNIPVSRPLTPDSEYTIDKLLQRMIAYSDNDAMTLLNDFVGTRRLDRISQEIGVRPPEPGRQYLLSVKEYASFFRILFNASYLNRQMSERGLSYLSQSAFKDGIVAGVPPAVGVAHKFGEREFLGPDSKVVRQLHDCGIVYFPQHPYLLCIMTRGDSFDGLSHAIQEISRSVYTELEHQYQ